MLAAAFYVFLKPVNPRIALFGAFARLADAAILAVVTLSGFAVVGRYIRAMRLGGQTRSWILGKLAAIAYAHDLIGLPKPRAMHPELQREIKGLHSL